MLGCKSGDYKIIQSCVIQLHMYLIQPNRCSYSYKHTQSSFLVLTATIFGLISALCVLTFFKKIVILFGKQC